LNIKHYPAVLLLSLGAAFSNSVQATVVEVRTVVGNFQVNLFDEETPQTVNNFLEYVNSGSYANNTVHRSAPNFVIQMGGFQYNNSFPPDAIATGAPVINEPVYSNRRGTLAMAKLGNNANSATSQFFVNLRDNSTNLDAQNGGFSVFGQVLGDGMNVVDSIAALSRYNFGGAFEEIPLRNYSATDAANNVMPNENNVVIITDIVIIDNTVITNPNLNPVRNPENDPVLLPVPPDSSSSGGGSMGALLLLGAGIVGVFRRPYFVKQ